MRKIEKVLYSYKDKKYLIHDYNIQIEMIKNDLGDIRGISYEEKSTPTNKFNSSVENEIVKKDKIIYEIENEKQHLQLHVNRIDNMLKILSDEEREIIELRYFEKLKFNQIADRLDRNEIALISKNTNILNRLEKFYYKNIMKI
ncbi:hypothetical protein B2H84_03105 [Clostridium botulinum]|uniref:RNA polymerase sigma factor n=1 Tax=Clostridium botulinum TaxID=1491 RepID=UPI000A178120|nr:sigma factor-like helix-turn-helix DNA-binding protein [Clostridium botulinum]OSA84090.1 hypothetical protein B2H84_03105 [Clostridium botulinum]